MSQQLIKQLQKKFRELEVLFKTVNPSDISVLNDLSTYLDQVKEQLKPLERAELNRPQQVIHIWSDGACSGNPGPGGWGTIVQVGDHIEELSGYSAKTTNNIMEMTGAIMGLKITPIGASIILTSDSQYVVKGMKEWIKGWKKRNWKKADGKPVKNKAFWIALDSLANERNIRWEWVKGHAEHPQNERCDELARNAISDRK